jgi:hypothetical protein
MCARKTVSPVHTTSLRVYSLYRPATGRTVEMLPLLKSVYLSCSATDYMLYKELLCKCQMPVCLLLLETLVHGTIFGMMWMKMTEAVLQRH